MRTQDKRQLGTRSQEGGGERGTAADGGRGGTGGGDTPHRAARGGTGGGDNVKAASAVGFRATAILGVPRPGGGGGGGGGSTTAVPLGVPRPGGGVIRRAGASGGEDAARGSAPYYPSADPGRLGSRTTAPST